MSPDGVLVATGQKAPLQWHVRLQQMVTIVSLLVILAAMWKADARLRIAAALICLSIIGKSIICAVVSAADIRYENRVLWLLPLLAFATLAQRVRISRSGTPRDRFD